MIITTSDFIGFFSLAGDQISNSESEDFQKIASESELKYGSMLLGVDLYLDYLANPENYENLTEGGKITVDGVNYIFNGFKSAIIGFIVYEWLRFSQNKREQGGAFTMNAEGMENNGVNDTAFLAYNNSLTQFYYGGQFLLENNSDYPLWKTDYFLPPMEINRLGL